MEQDTIGLTSRARISAAAMARVASAGGFGCKRGECGAGRLGKPGLRLLRRLAWVSLLLGGKAQAQDALFSALSLDRSLALPGGASAVVNAAPPFKHLGPVQIGLGAYASGEYNDNISLQPNNTESDEILHEGVSGSLKWQATDKSQLSLTPSIGYAHYLHHSRYDSIEVAPGSALSYQAEFPQGNIAVFDQLSYVYSAMTDAALSGLATYPRLENTAGGRVTWMPSRYTLQAGYSHDDFDAESAQFSYTSRSSEYLFARGAYRFAEATLAGIETSLSFSRYWQSFLNNYRSISVGPYTEWRVTEDLSTSVHGGASFYTFDPNRFEPGSDLTSYYVSFDLTHQLTSFLSQHGTLQRDIRPSLYQGSSPLEDLVAAYTISWALTQHLALSANVTYENGSQSLTVLQGEDFYRYGGGPGISYRFSDHLSSNLSYTYYSRHSNLPDRGYTLDLVNLGLNYTF